LTRDSCESCGDNDIGTLWLSYKINSLAAQPPILLRHVPCPLPTTCSTRCRWTHGHLAFHGRRLVAMIKRLSMSFILRTRRHNPFPLSHFFYHANFDCHVPRFHGKTQMSLYLDHHARGALEELNVKKKFCFHFVFLLFQHVLW
jgi:hypothetical protein